MITLQRKIGRNRGKPRLWIEGKALTDAGLTHGTRWDLLSSAGGALFIAGSPDGARKVTGSPDRPVIDIAGSSLDPLRVVNGGHIPATVTLTFRPGEGCLKVEADEIADRTIDAL